MISDTTHAAAARWVEVHSTQLTKLHISKEEELLNCCQETHSGRKKSGNRILGKGDSQVVCLTDFVVVHGLGVRKKLFMV